MSIQEKKPYPLELWPEEHQGVKRASAERRVSMGAWIRHLIRRELGLPTLGAPGNDNSAEGES